MAVLTITGTYGQFSFLTAQATEGGFLYQVPEIVEEVLTTPGVSGRRWRTVQNQFAPAAVSTVAEAADFNAAIVTAANYMSLVGTLVSVGWTVAGFPISYRNVHVAKVDAQPVAGQPVGGGASTSSTAHVRAVWVLEATEFSASVNP